MISDDSASPQISGSPDSTDLPADPRGREDRWYRERMGLFQKLADAPNAARKAIATRALLECDQKYGNDTPTDRQRWHVWYQAYIRTRTSSTIVGSRRVTLGNVPGTTVIRVCRGATSNSLHGILRAFPKFDALADITHWLTTVTQLLSVAQIPLDQWDVFITLGLAEDATAAALVRNASDLAAPGGKLDAVMDTLEANYGVTEEHRRQARHLLNNLRMGATETAAQYYTRWQAARTEAYKGQPIPFNDEVVFQFTQSLTTALQKRCANFLYYAPDKARHGGTNNVYISTPVELRDRLLTADSQREDHMRAAENASQMFHQLARESTSPANLNPLASIGQQSVGHLFSTLGQEAFRTPRIDDHSVGMLDHHFRSSGNHAAIQMLNGSLRPMHGGQHSNNGGRGRSSRRGGERPQQQQQQQPYQPPRDERGRYSSPDRSDNAAHPRQQQPQRRDRSGGRPTGHYPADPYPRGNQRGSVAVRPASMAPNQRSTSSPARTPYPGSAQNQQGRPAFGGTDRPRPPPGQTCSDCNNPLHTWEYCPRNKNGKAPGDFAPQYKGSGPLYTGKILPDGSPERVSQQSRGILRPSRPGGQHVTFSDTTLAQRLVVNGNMHRDVVVDCMFGRVPAPGAVVDTGAQRSILSKRFYEAHRGNFPLLNRVATLGIVIEGVAGHAVRPLGEIHVPITFCDETTQKNYHVLRHPFLVVDGMSADVLIGMDLMHDHRAIRGVTFATGAVTYSPQLRTTPYSPPTGTAAQYPVRLLHAVTLAPGQTLPVTLRIGDAGDDHSQVGGSVLITPAALATNKAATPLRFSLTIPEQLRTLEQGAERSIVTTASNPTNRVLLIHAGTLVARATLLDDRYIQTDVTPPARTSPASARYPPTPAGARMLRAIAALTPRARRAWLDSEVERFAGLLTTAPAVRTRIRFSHTRHVSGAPLTVGDESPLGIAAPGEPSEESS